MSTRDNLDFLERTARLFLEHTSKSVLLSEATLRTKDRLLLVALTSIGLLSGAVLVTKLELGGSEVTLQSVLAIRIGFGVTCTYLIALLLAQVAQICDPSAIAT